MAQKAEMSIARKENWLDLILRLLLIGGIGVAMTGLLAWQLPFGGQVDVQAGEVVSADIVSPRRVSYESTILTEQVRERAAAAVPDYYDPPEGRVRRQQVSRAREILEFVSTVRLDAYATPELKIDYILAVPDWNLSPEIASRLLDLSDQEWQAVVEEVPQALDRAMRDEIRENSLALARRRVPTLISADLNEDVSDVAAEFVRALIRPNSLFNAERTQELRAQAMAEVPVQTNTLEQGEIILRAGDIATPVDVEALDTIGLRQSEWSWWRLVRAGLFTLLLLGGIGGALYRLRPRALADWQELALLAVVIIVGLAVAKLMIVPHDLLPYFFPLAALGMLVAVLLDVNVAVVLTLAFVLLINDLGNGDAALTIYSGAGALCGLLVVGRGERLTAFLWAGLAVILSNLVVATAYWAPSTELGASFFLQRMAVVLINGGLSASIALLGYFILGNLFGITTSLQLMELSRPTHPLLRQLLLKAPGSYHHTILVSNLAERAAEAIGADAFLTRVGAYYHDIGKIARPYFFAENIVDSNSPHDKLDPLTSAQIIVSHVKDGVDLAHKYHLPPPILHFIREHHGTQLVQYFYYQAQQQAEEGEVVQESDFRYPGPDPHTKETAIMMLADTCEAAVRAIKPATREELEDMVGQLFTERVLAGSLGNSNLTFRELKTVRQVFIQVLQGVHHPRIRYPGQLQEEKAEVGTAVGDVSSSRTEVAPSNGSRVG